MEVGVSCDEGSAGLELNALGRPLEAEASGGDERCSSTGLGPILLAAEVPADSQAPLTSLC